MHSQRQLAEAIAELSQQCPVVAKLANTVETPPLRRKPAGFPGLVEIIISQQLSTASAAAIHNRLKNNLQPMSSKTMLSQKISPETISPKTILPKTIKQASLADLRACGLSASKANTVQALAAAVLTGAIDLRGRPSAWPATRAQLLSIRGIGPWTADIYEIFCLRHPNAFASGDLALQEAARTAFDLSKRPTARELMALVEHWSPLRGAGARLLWAYYNQARQPPA